MPLCNGRVTEAFIRFDPRYRAAAHRRLRGSGGPAAAPPCRLTGPVIRVQRELTPPNECPLLCAHNKKACPDWAGFLGSSDWGSLKFQNLTPKTFNRKKTEKKNPKKMKLRIRIISLHNFGLYSFGRNFLFRRRVATAESAIVKLAMLALTAKMIRGNVIFMKRAPQMTKTISKK